MNNDFENSEAGAMWQFDKNVIRSNDFWLMCETPTYTNKKVYKAAISCNSPIMFLGKDNPPLKATWCYYKVMAVDGNDEIKVGWLGSVIVKHLKLTRLKDE